MPKTILHIPSLTGDMQSKLLSVIPGTLLERGDYYIIQHNDHVAPQQLEAFRQQVSFDVNTLPDDFQADSVALVITDMDSTLISIECVDEIADFLGIKEQVAIITESAMRGEIDFNTSLQKRVKLLEGLEYDVLDQVYRERLTLNPGAEQMLEGLQAKGIKTALVSGGFTFFTDRLKERLKLDFTLSNTLETRNGALTGNVLGDIVNGEIKAGFLQKLVKDLDIEPNRTIAVGDGANDLPMMNIAGLGVAYHAKPKVQQQADAVLNHSGLDAVLHFLDAGDY